MRSPFFSLAFKNQAPMNAERDPFPGMSTADAFINGSGR
jgi:hypothetical protein